MTLQSINIMHRKEAELSKEIVAMVSSNLFKQETLATAKYFMDIDRVMENLCVVKNVEEEEEEACSSLSLLASSIASEVRASRCSSHRDLPSHDLLPVGIGQSDIKRKTWKITAFKGGAICLKKRRKGVVLQIFQRSQFDRVHLSRMLHARHWHNAYHRPRARQCAEPCIIT